MYGTELWGNCATSTRLLTWQKKALRIMLGLKPHDSCRSAFVNLKIMTLPSIYIYKNLLYVHENFHEFKTRLTVHEHNTRGKFNLDTPHVRLAKSVNSNKFQQLKLYNNLPMNTRNLEIQKFKNTLKIWLKGKAFYSVSEYFDVSKSDLNNISTQ